MTPPPRYVAIQRNPHSGPRARRQELLELIRELRIRGFTPRMFSRRERLRHWMNDERRRSRLECLVAAGGDGTVDDLVSRYPGVRLAVLPLGTENLLAKSLGISRSGQALADFIAAGVTRRMDLVAHGDRRFCLMASVGIDAEVIRRVHHYRRGHASRWKYAWHILRSLGTYRFPELDVYLDDAAEPLKARQVFLINHPAYALGLKVAPEARSDDGLLNLWLFSRGGVSHTFGWFLAAWFGRLGQSADLVARTAARVRLTSVGQAPVQVDGDPAGHAPLELTVVPNALEIVVPPTATDRRG
jgi:diacylglycerol kinase family enzyme